MGKVKKSSTEETSILSKKQNSKKIVKMAEEIIVKPQKISKKPKDTSVMKVTEASVKKSKRTAKTISDEVSVNWLIDEIIILGMHFMDCSYLVLILYNTLN